MSTRQIHRLFRTRSPRAARALLEAVEPRQLLTTVSGSVYDDQNRNDQREGTEPGVSGSSVFADYNYDGKLSAGEPSVTVAANGAYTLSTDAGKPFALRVSPPSGYEQVGLLQGGKPYYFNGTESSVSNRNFALATPATATVSVITGTVFDDYNHDGVRSVTSGTGADATLEPALFGRTVYADLNQNGTLDANEPSTSTRYLPDASVGFQLVVPHAAFTLRAIPTTGYTISTPGHGSGVPLDLTSNAPLSLSRDVGLFGAGDFVSGYVIADETAYMAGVHAPAGQVVFIDLDRDRVLDANETIKTTTDANGFYYLPFDRNAVVGSDNNFQVAVIPTGNYVQNPGAGLVGTAGVGSLLPMHPELKLGIRTVVAPPTTTALTVTVYRDGNGNQHLDPQETGAAGQLVFADYNYNGVLDAGEPSATTTSATTVSLNVDQRPFALRLLTSVGFNQSLPAGGPNYIEFRNGVLVGGTTFALTPSVVTISGSFANDVNGNGSLDPGEFTQPLPAGFTATVYIDLNDNGQLDANEPQAIANSTTGAYTISVPPGSGGHDLRFVIDTANFRPTGVFDYPHPFTDVIDRTTDVLYSSFTITTVGGTVGVTAFRDTNGDGIQQADEYPTGSAWIDLNGNGVKDDGEPTPYYDIVGGHPPSNNSYLGKVKLAYGTYRVALDTNNDSRGDLFQYVTISAASPAGSADFIVPAAQVGQFYFQPTVDGTDQLFPRAAADRAYYQFFGNDYSLWADLNRDGVRQANEPLATRITSPLGNPRLAFTLPYGFYAIAVAASSAVGSAAIRSCDYQLDASTVGTVHDAYYGYTLPALTGVALGYVFKDNDKDGVYNFNVDQLLTGKAGSPGWAQVWADYNDNGKIDAGEPLAQLGSDGTDSTLDGIYVLKTGQTFTLGSIAYAGLKGDTSTPLASTSAKQRVTLGTANSPLRIDRGFGDAQITPPPAHAPFPTVYVYLDTNKNGTIDPSEAVASNGAAGQTVFADYNYNGTLDAGEPSTVTDASGSATLSAANKPFALRLKPASGFTQSAPASNGVYYYELRDGTPFGYGNTFGLTGSVTPPTTGKSEIDVFYFVDYDGDGKLTAADGEFLHEDATVFDSYIDMNRNDTFDAGDQRIDDISYTGGGFRFFFDQLAAGTYHIVLGSKLATGESIVGGATRDVTVGDNASVRLAVPVAGYKLAQVMPNVFYDTNGSGFQEAGERSASEYDGLNLFADLNFNGVYDAGEPTGSFPNHYGQSYPWELAPGSYSIRVAFADGTPATFAYGATSRWVTLAKPGVFTTQLGIVNHV